MKTLHLNSRNIADYQKFLRIKSLPNYEIRGRIAYVPDEYAGLLDGNKLPDDEPIDLHPSLFDYQAAISRIAIRKRRFAVFARCGLGKTLIMLEFARHAARALPNKAHLIISPLMVIDQTIDECQKWYGFTPERIASSE
jgi:superfamily II DNA or RNA helicase